MSVIKGKQPSNETGKRGSSPPTHRLYFEDHIPGSIVEYGTISVDEAEIIDFGRKFDPQVFHTDPKKAGTGPFHGLVASGLHTLGLMMRLYVDHHLSKVATLGSPGLDEVRWIRPVRPGDTLQIRVSIVEANRSLTKPDRGVVITLTEVLNQSQKVVMTVKGIMILRCRERVK